MYHVIVWQIFCSVYFKDIYIPEDYECSFILHQFPNVAPFRCIFFQINLFQNNFYSSSNNFIENVNGTTKLHSTSFYFYLFIYVALPFHI